MMSGEAQIHLTWREGDPLDVPVGILGMQAVVVRLTGGLRTVSPAGALTAYYGEAFAGFRGGLISGGAQYRVGSHLETEPNVTHMAPFICSRETGAVGVCVIPGHLFSEREGQHMFAVQRTEDGRIEDGWRTYIAPEYRCVMLMGQRAMSRGNIWDDQVWLSQALLERLESWRLARTYTVAYGGGRMTRYELELAAQAGRQVVLVAGSAGESDALAADSAFCERPNVHTVQVGQPGQLRELLAGA